MSARFALLVTFGVAVVLAGGPTAQAQTLSAAPPQFTTVKSVSCCTYHLGDLADDPNFSKWIAETIPEIIQPGSWTGDRTVRCYAPARILVVTHTPAVQAEIDTFLKSLKSAMPQTKTAKAPTTTAVQPAAHVSTVPLRTPEPLMGPKQLAYPVPAATMQPKHLFHFIIRYEGEGSLALPIAEVAKSLGAEVVTEDKPTSPAAKAPDASSQGQAFHLILRYEGEGLIDSTVAGLLKTLYAESMLGQASPPVIGPPSEPPPPPPEAAPRKPKALPQPPPSATQATPPRTALPIAPNNPIGPLQPAPSNSPALPPPETKR